MTEHKTMRFPNLVLQFPFLTVHRVPYRYLLPETDKERAEREEKRKRRLSSGNAANCPLEIWYSAVFASDVEIHKPLFSRDYRLSLFIS